MPREACWLRGRVFLRMRSWENVFATWFMFIVLLLWRVLFVGKPFGRSLKGHSSFLHCVNGSRFRLQTGSGARVKKRRKDRRGCASVAMPMPIKVKELVEVAVLVPHEQVVGQLAVVSEILSHDGILQRAVERIVDFPPFEQSVTEEAHAFAQERISKRSGAPRRRARLVYHGGDR